MKIKQQTVKHAGLNLDARVLDVCCGTGDIAICVARDYAQNGSVVGVDLSDGMLRVAKEKACNLNNIKFIEADALALPFKDGEFDVSFISFGLRNLPDFKKGLLEMKRVTKKGGLVVNLDMCRPTGFSCLTHYPYLFGVVPIMGALFYGDYRPYLYLAKSIKNFLTQKELVSLFKEVGLNDVKSYGFLLGAIGAQMGRV